MYIRILLLYCCGLLALSAFGQTFFEDTLLNRRVPGNTAYHVCVISNMEPLDAMQPLCGFAAMQMKELYSIKLPDRAALERCVYLPLASVGTYGRRKDELLPYDVDRNVTTFVAVNQATLTDAEKAVLGKLFPQLFPNVKPLPVDKVCAYVQHRGKGKYEYQGYLSVPDARWFGKLCEDVRKMPPLVGNYDPPYTFTQAVTRTAVLTNDAKVKELMQSQFRYDDTQAYTLDQFDAYRDDAIATRRVLALNWNGDEEIGPAMAVQLLPTPLQARCRELAPDRMGITGWQRFCRSALAQRFQQDGVDLWSITAPTAPYLQALAAQVVKNRFQGGPYRVDVTDLSYVTRLSVGVYVANQSVDPKVLVEQQRLEEVARAGLGTRVQFMVSTQNWGQILQDALGRNADTDNPFGRPEALRSVNQASNADAVLLLWVRSLSPSVTHGMQTRRLTPRYPDFSEKEPSAPDPDGRLYGILGPHVYPGDSRDARSASKAYQQDYRDWQDKHGTWEVHRREWRRGYEGNHINYEYVVTAKPKLEMTGYLKLVDIKATQQLLWSSEVALNRENDPRTLETIQVQVIGEGRDPRRPDFGGKYTDAFSWAECARQLDDNSIYQLGQDVLLASLQDGVARLSTGALWASDLKPWNQPVRRVRE